MADVKTGKIAAAIAYTNTTAYSIGDLPPNSIITDVYVMVATAFNAGGNDYVDVGISGTQAKFANDINVASTGRKEPSALTNVGAAENSTASTAIYAIYVPAGTSPSAGAGYVVVEYAQL